MYYIQVINYLFIAKTFCQQHFTDDTWLYLFTFVHVLLVIDIKGALDSKY